MGFLLLLLLIDYVTDPTPLRPLNVRRLQQPKRIESLEETEEMREYDVDEHKELYKDGIPEHLGTSSFLIIFSFSPLLRFASYKFNQRLH